MKPKFFAIRVNILPLGCNTSEPSKCWIGKYYTDPILHGKGIVIVEAQTWGNFTEAYTRFTANLHLLLKQIGIVSLRGSSMGNKFSISWKGRVNRAENNFSLKVWCMINCWGAMGPIASTEIKRHVVQPS